MAKKGKKKKNSIISKLVSIVLIVAAIAILTGVYVQTYARGEYMFSKGDEKVFYLPGD